MFPEEYWQCADVRILPNPAFAPPPSPPRSFPSLTPSFGQQSGETEDRSLAVSADGEGAGFRRDGDVESMEEDHGELAGESEADSSESVQQGGSTGAGEVKTKSSDQQVFTEAGIWF